MAAYFVGTRHELQQSLNDSIKNVRENLPEFIEMRWDLHPPFAPLFGGVWKRMIQTAKRTLLIILGSRKLTLDFFQTILTETDLMLNCRPLTHVIQQPDNEERLTSNHFYFSGHIQQCRIRADALHFQWKISRCLARILCK